MLHDDSIGGKDGLILPKRRTNVLPKSITEDEVIRSMLRTRTTNSLHQRKIAPLTARLILPDRPEHSLVSGSALKKEKRQS